MKRKFFILAFLTLIVLITPIKSNAYSTDPKQFISEIVLDAKKILNSNVDKETKSKKLSDIARVTVDIKGIAYYTLGSYRKNLKEGEMKEYLEIFEKYFLKSFTSRLTDYSDPKIDVLQAEVLNPKYTMDKSLLLGTSEKPEVKIDWRVYTKNPENPLIRDVIIEGLSLARTQKEEFASIIETNDGDLKTLFAKLKEFINK